MLCKEHSTVLSTDKRPTNGGCHNTDDTIYNISADYCDAAAKQTFQGHRANTLWNHGSTALKGFDWTRTLVSRELRFPSSMGC